MKPNDRSIESFPAPLEKNLLIELENRIRLFPSLMSICKQLSIVFDRKNNEIFVLIMFVCFSCSVQMYKLHQNERANTRIHTKKPYTHWSHMSEKQIKECIPYTQSSSNQNRSNRQRKKRNNKKKSKGEMHSFFFASKMRDKRAEREKTDRCEQWNKNAKKEAEEKQRNEGVMCSIVLFVL